MADDPVEQAAEGTATEAAEETAADSNGEIEAEASELSADDAEGEDSDAGEDGQGSHDVVKYSRFRNVNERRKAAEEALKVAEAKLAALQPKEEAKPASLRDRLKKLDQAPRDMTPLEQMEYYGLETFEKHADEVIGAWFKKRFGMDPEAAGATLSHASVSTRDQIRRDFTTACAERGLDPKDSALADTVGTLMDSGRYKTFGEAMDVFKPKTTARTEPRKVNGNGKGAEVDSVDLAGLSRVRALPRSREEAMKLAAQGKRIEPVSVKDILRATMEKT